MEGLCRVTHCRLRSSVVGAGDALTEVVRLNPSARKGKVVARELPINFVHVVARQ